MSTDPLVYSSTTTHRSGDETVPPFTRRALEAIRDPDHFREVLDAYHQGEILDNPKRCPGRHLRIRGAIGVVVADSGLVLAVRQRYEQVETLPPVSGQRRRRGKGGAGTRTPVSVDEIVERAAALGADVRLSGKNHYRVSLPTWSSPVIIPNTPSDFRVVRNATRELARRGLDVTRPCLRKHGRDRKCKRS